MNLITAVRSLYEAFGTGDIAAILSRLSPDVRWEANVDWALPAARNVPCYRPGRGRSFVAEYFAVFAKNYRVHDFRVVSILEGAGEEGGEAVARLRVDLTIIATGKRVRGEVFHHYTFGEGGLVTRFLDVEDTLGFSSAWA